MGEPLEVVQEIKMKEIRALMRIGWESDIETNEIIEKSLGELIEFYGRKETITDSEKQFVINTIKVIEGTLKRECKVKF